MLCLLIFHNPLNFCKTIHLVYKFINEPLDFYEKLLVSFGANKTIGSYISIQLFNNSKIKPLQNKVIGDMRVKFKN